MRTIARLAGIVFLVTAMPLHAVVTDPFPDQPGALSAEEIQAATGAMASAPGTGPALPLVASGKRSPGHLMPSYALFAGPLENYSDRVRTRKQIICNFMAGAWRCGAPVDQFRMSANGIEHVFTYQIVQARGDRQTAVDVVDFVYSQCFNTQFAALGGTPFTPSPDADFVSVVLDDGTGYTAITGPLGDGDSYRLEKTDRSADGCGFRIRHARMAKSGVMLPQSHAREQAQARQEGEAQLRRAQAEREESVRAIGVPVGAPVSDLRSIFGKLTDLALGLNALLAVAALIGPFNELAHGRKESAVRIAVILTSATVVLAAAVVVFLKLAALTDTGYSLLIVIPLTLLAVLSCVIWVVVGALARR